MRTKNSRIEQIAFTTLDAVSDWINILFCPGSIYKLIRKADEEQRLISHPLEDRRAKYTLATGLEAVRLISYVGLFYEIMK